MELPSISAIIPAYNEADNLPTLISDISNQFTTHGIDYEIVVVNDGSRDRTAEILALVTHQYPVRVVTHPRNLGYGAALKSGFAAAVKDWIFLTDGDGQFTINDLDRFLEHIPGSDFVIGYRTKRQDPSIRLFNAWLFHLAIYLLFGLRVRDVDCAFKVMRRTAVQAINPQSSGAFISSELLIGAQRCGYTIVELPVRHLPRRFGRPTGANPMVILRALRDVLWFRLTGKVYRSISSDPYRRENSLFQ